MNVADFVIIILLAFGAVEGFKAGFIKKTTDFIGMFVIVILSFTLKNNLSTIMYENLPFFSFGGFIKGIDAINILLYEIIAFLIIFAALYFILRAVLVVTGLIEKILKATVILSIPSKILGIFVGILESYIYIFIILVILTLPIFNIPFVRESRMVNFMLDDTPILSSMSSEMIDIYDNVYNIVINRKDKNNEEIIFSQSSQTLVNVLTAEGGDFCVSRNLYNLYDDKDYRKELYFKKNVSTDSIALNRKYSKKEGEAAPSDGFTLRVAEAYLNMAEACAMLDDAEACDWLNQLRRNRIGQYVDMQYSGEELINEIREERRKELCLEGHRWFDLRRYAACVKYPFKKEIVRVFAEYSQDNNYKFNTAELFRLEKDDPAYLFRIPVSIREYHEDMPDNERNVRKAFASLDADGNLIENE